MTRRTLPASLAGLVILFSSVWLYAQGVVGGRSIAYQGRLELDGAPVNGTVTLEFRLYDENGVVVAGPFSSEVNVVGGLFATEIGPLDESVLGRSELYVGVSVNGTELAERQRLTAAPYALRGAPGVELGAEGLRLHDQALFLRSSDDENHGIMFRQYVAGSLVDGPWIFGHSGGALGTTLNGDDIALKWSSDGTVTLPGILSFGHSFGTETHQPGHFRTINFARDNGDQIDAGEISYRTIRPDSLSIVGAGDTDGNRLVDIFDHLRVNGEIFADGRIDAPRGVKLGQPQTCNEDHRGTVRLLVETHISSGVTIRDDYIAYCGCSYFDNDLVACSWRPLDLGD